MRLSTVLFFVVSMISITSSALADDVRPYLEQIAAEAAIPLPTCDGLIGLSRTTCNRIRAAQEAAQNCELSVYRKGDRLMRAFCIVAHEPISDELRTIMLEMPVIPEARFQPRVTSMHDPPLIAIRTGGSSYIKMRFAIFEAHDAGRTWYPYAAKYLSIPITANLSSLKSVEEHAVPKVYLAADTHLLDREIARKGLQFGWRVIQDIHEKARGIPSRARADRTVADVVPAHFLLGLFVAEQTDHDVFFGGRGWEGFDAAMEDPLQNEAVQMVGLALFMNGITTYSQIRSSAGACGSWQFMQATYHMVRRKYPDAGLDPDYLRGCQGFLNLGKSAPLLVDSDLAESGTLVHAHFDRDPELSTLYFAAKYNGGKQRGEYIARFVDRYEKSRKVRVTVDTFPWSEFRQAVRRDGKKSFPHETLGYIRKIANLLTLSRFVAEQE